MAEIPIQLHYFQKLKLYHDFLKNSRMLESTKKEYWLLGKAILLWAYSPHHQHIGRPLDFSIFLANTHSTTIQDFAEKILGDDVKLVKWVSQNSKDAAVLIQVISNLDVLEFIETISRFDKEDIDSGRVTHHLKNYTDQFRITMKGFLLGELLNEKVNKPMTYFWKYWVGDVFLQVTFWLFAISAIIIAIKQIF